MNKIIAIDGPAGSGKGTISKIIGEKCGYVYVDTGLSYRSIALLVIRNNIDLDETEKIINLVKTTKMALTETGRMLLNEEDVTDLLRSKEVTNIVSQVSSIPKIREIAVEIQRAVVHGKDAILEGRDITTVVFPNATYKFYLDASLEERAKRRNIQNIENNIDMNYEEILANIEMRDNNDMNKEVGALKRTDEQVYIDTTNMSIDEVVEKILTIVKR